MRASASNRLFRDIAEFYRDSYPGIKLHFVGEKSVSSKDWCILRDRFKCGVRHAEAYACLELTPSSGLFEDIPFHFEIVIPHDYPSEPPRISVSTAIKHPHVYGSWICADILNISQSTSRHYTAGYTPAYTLCGVALQMLSFFTNETLENEDGGNHLSRLSWNWKLKEILTIPHSRNDDTRKKQLNYVIKIDIKTIKKERHLKNSAISDGNQTKDGNGGENRRSYSKRELRCLFTKLTRVETTLGFGLHVENEGSQVFTLSEFEYIIYVAFDTHKVRLSVWKKPFEFFLPYAICKEHFSRSFTCLQRSVRKLAQNVLVPKYMSMEDLERPFTAMTLLIKMMNSIVVSLFKVASSHNERHVLVAASEKAVQVYVSILHLVLSLMERHDEFAKEIEEKVEKFVETPNYRLKERTPDIGEWLMYLGLSQKSMWNHDVAKKLIPQFLSRTVMWMLRKNVDSFPNPNALYPYIYLAHFESEGGIRHSTF
ncbi:hypothetical protein HK098_002182 [Nowakowskiella sp. JEL0407]|nr:hypothetical protein HK098_002182 [Nowakowskiella sp. JEL0407]